MPRRGFSWKSLVDPLKRSDAVLRLADRLGRGRGRLRWLDSLVDPPPPPRRPNLRGWDRHPLAACWIGHATLLFRLEGRTILTDPVFSNRVGIGLLLATGGPKRLQQPAVPLDRLPPIDLIALSHAHFDHLDRPSLHRLARQFPKATVVCAAGTRDLVDDLGFGAVIEMSVGETRTLCGMDVLAIPVRHWGPRVFIDGWRTYQAYRFSRGGRSILFGGDTALTGTFAGVGPVDLMAVGVGAYDPYVAAHATPEQAWAMAQQAEATKVAAMHHTTFKLSYEPIGEPLRRFLSAAGDQADDIVIRHVGDVWVAHRYTPRTN